MLRGLKREFILITICLDIVLVAVILRPNWMKILLSTTRTSSINLWKQSIKACSDQILTWSERGAITAKFNMKDDLLCNLGSQKAVNRLRILFKHLFNWGCAHYKLIFKLLGSQEFTLTTLNWQVNSRSFKVNIYKQGCVLVWLCWLSLTLLYHITAVPYYCNTCNSHNKQM